jgi:hypothetical protein
VGIRGKIRDILQAAFLWFRAAAASSPTFRAAQTGEHHPAAAGSADASITSAGELQ